MVIQLKQVVPGSINVNPNSIRSATCRGTSFVGACAGNKVVIFSAKLAVVQTLILDHEVSCLEWCDNNEDGRLAVASNNAVTIYSLRDENGYSTSHESTFLWRKYCVIQTDYNVYALSWNSTGDILLCGGDALTLWKVNEKEPTTNKTLLETEDERKRKDEALKQLLWKTNTTTPTRYCSFSADGRYFATLGDHDRFVKIWYLYKEGHYRFIYLPHPRAITNIVWRRKDKPADPNVLLAASRTNAVVLWMETRQGDRLQFKVASTIEAGAGSVADWLSGSTLDKAVIGHSPSSPLVESSPSNGTVGLPPTGLSIDWVVTVQKTGMVSIWKVKGLMQHNKRTPTYSMWARFSIASSQTTVNLKLIASCRSFSGDDRNFPLKFNLYILNMSGSMNCWDCVVDIGETSPKISPILTANCFGHKGSITNIIAHPYLPLLASIDGFQKTIIWKSNEGKLADPTAVLSNISLFDNAPMFAWSPLGSVVLTCNNRGVFVYEVELGQDSSNKSALLLGILADSDKCTPLSYIQVFSSINDDPDWSVIGISESGDKIYLWSMQKPKSRNPSLANLQVGKLIDVKDLGSESKITCAASAQFVFVEENNTSNRKENVLFSFVTGGADGTLRAWKLHPKDAHKLEQVSSMKCYDQPFSKIACGTYGYIASTSLNCNEIHIWRVEESKTIPMEHFITFSNRKTLNDISFSWLSTGDGNNCLAVAKATEIKLVFKSCKTEIGSYGAAWTEVPLASPNSPVHSLVWTVDGSLVCAASNHMFVYTKWIDPNHNKTSNEKFATIFHKSSSLYRALSFYHPRMLIQYLISGHFNKVAFILKHLYTYLTKDEDSGESGKVKHVTPLSIEALTATVENKAEKPKEQDQYSFLNTSSAPAPDKTEQEENQIFSSREAKKLSEMLTSVSFPDVLGTEQMLLIAVVDTFAQMQETRGGLDNCGVKYLLSHKIFSFLKRSLPPSDRPQTMSSFDIAWAMHSEAEGTIIQTCLPDGLTWNIAKSMGVGLWVRNPTNLKNIVEKIAKAQFAEKKDPMDCSLFYIALKKTPALSALFKATGNQKLADFLKNNFNDKQWITAALANAYVLVSKHKYELAAAWFLLGGQLKDAVGICLQKMGDFQLAIVLARLIEGEGPVFEYILNSYVLPLAQETGDSSLASIALWQLKKYSDSISALLPNTPPPQSSSAPSTPQSIRMSQGPQNPPPSLSTSVTIGVVSTGSSSSLSASSVIVNVPAQPSLEAKKRELQSFEKFNPSVLHLFDFLRSHTMLRNSTVNLEDLHFDLAKKAAYLYTDSGYTLLALEQLKNLVQMLAKRITDENKAEERKEPAPEVSSIFGNYGRFLRNFDGMSSSPAVTTTKQLSSSKFLDRSVIYKVALQLLSAHASQVDQAGTANLLKQNFKDLCTVLEIDEQVLVLSLVGFCEIRQYFKSVFELFEGSRDRQTLMMGGNARYVSDLARFSTLPNLSGMTGSQLLSLSRQIWECFKLSESQIMASERSEIQCAVDFGLFLYALSRQRYSVLQMILQQKTTDNVLAELIKLETNEIKGDYEESRALKANDMYEMDETILPFVSHLFQLLVLKKYHDKIEISYGKTSPRAGPEIIKALNRWIAETVMEVSVLPVPVGKASKLNRLFNNPKGFLNLFTEFAKRSELYKYHSFSSLWDYLVADEGLINYTSELPYKSSTSSESDKETLQFSDTLIIYMDRDILQSFCINSKDSTQVAMATTRGIREITLTKERKMDMIDEDEQNDTPKDDGHHLDASLDSSLSKSTGKSRVDLHRSDSSVTLSPFNILNKSVNSKKIPVENLVSKQIDRNILVQWLESHPVFPYYLSGGIDGSICLWQFNAPKDTALMATYVLPPNPRVTRIHFNARGTKFGAADMSGKLSLWRFDASEASLKPYQTLQCHNKSTLDFTYINSGSVLATAGISSDKGNVCMWDTLLPPNQSLVATFNAHDSGASSLIYSPRYNLLITGGKKGEIAIFDIRMQKELQTLKAHTMNVKSLDLDPQEEFFVSGSNEGNVKAWDLPTFQLRETWEDMHMKHTFVRKPGVFTAPVSTYGVMQVMLTTKYVYTCGSDGRILRTPYFKAHKV